MQFDIRRKNSGGEGVNLLSIGVTYSRFDVYRKVPKDLTQPTQAGAIISILSAIVMSFLFLSEFYSFITPEVVSELFVDMSGSQNDRMKTSLNITLPRLKCNYIGLDIQDEMGRHEVGFQENTQKFEIDGGGGCRFEGHFEVNKVPGNFHISTHGAGQQPDNVDMTHVINGLRFGDEIHLDNIDAAFVSLNEMDKGDASAISSHDYVLRVVPTIYEKLNGKRLYSFQYTWAYKDYVSYGHGGRVLPAIWFRYDLSPITVKYVERRKPFYHFITTVFAIVGGTFSVAGIIDSLLFTASELFKKFQLGKLSQAISNPAEEVSSAIGRLEFTEASNENSSLLKCKEKLRKQHQKRETEREKMRNKIRLKYGIKESERHKGLLSSKHEVIESEKAKLFANEEQHEEESCLACFLCCFKKWYKRDSLELTNSTKSRKTREHCLRPSKRESRTSYKWGTP